MQNMLRKTMPPRPPESHNSRCCSPLAQLSLCLAHRLPSMSNWYNNKGGNYNNWNNGWNKGGWRQKGSGKGHSQTPITDLVTSLQSSMKEQQLLQALAPALIGGSLAQTAPTPSTAAAPQSSGSSIPDELKSVLVGLKDSLDNMAKVQSTAAPVMPAFAPTAMSTALAPTAMTPWTPNPAPACQAVYRQDAADCEVQMLKRELGDFRDSLRLLQQTHPIGQLQQGHSSTLTPPPRKRPMDTQDSADKITVKLPKVQLPSKTAPNPKQDDDVIITKDIHKKILQDVFELPGIRSYGDLTLEQWCSKHANKIPEEDIAAVAQCWGLEPAGTEDMLVEITKLWLLQNP
jgi:hypothetical protein